MGFFLTDDSTRFRTLPNSIIYTKIQLTPSLLILRYHTKPTTVLFDPVSPLDNLPPPPSEKLVIMPDRFICLDCGSTRCAHVDASPDDFELQPKSPRYRNYDSRNFNGDRRGDYYPAFQRGGFNNYQPRYGGGGRSGLFRQRPAYFPTSPPLNGYSNRKPTPQYDMFKTDYDFNSANEHFGKLMSAMRNDGPKKGEFIWNTLPFSTSFGMIWQAGGFFENETLHLTLKSLFRGLTLAHLALQTYCFR